MKAMIVCFTPFGRAIKFKINAGVERSVDQLVPQPEYGWLRRKVDLSIFIDSSRLCACVLRSLNCLYKACVVPIKHTRSTREGLQSL